MKRMTSEFSMLCLDMVLYIMDGPIVKFASWATLTLDIISAIRSSKARTHACLLVMVNHFFEETMDEDLVICLDLLRFIYVLLSLMTLSYMKSWTAFNLPEMNSILFIIISITALSKDMSPARGMLDKEHPFLYRLRFQVF